jgi:hypothetical protein
MNYTIIDTAEKAISLLLTAEMNEITWKTMFSNKDLYLKWLWNRCFEKNCRVVGVFNSHNFCLGYLVITLNRSYDSDELYIHDLFVVPEERKTKTSEYLYEAVVDVFFTTKHKRLRWCSTAIPQEYWEGKMFGFKVNTIKYYTIDNDEKARENYENNYKNRD